MPEQLTAPRAGLFTKQETPVPLDGVSIDAEISTFCARVADRSHVPPGSLRLDGW
jgi:hypothetical protein